MNERKDVPDFQKFAAHSIHRFGLFFSVSHNFCDALLYVGQAWLVPLPDKSLPHLQIRESLLKQLLEVYRSVYFSPLF